MLLIFEQQLMQMSIICTYFSWVIFWYFLVSRGSCVLVFVYTHMWRVHELADRWNILHALSLTLFSRHISHTFHSQRYKIHQNHKTHYDRSECQSQIKFNVEILAVCLICQDVFHMPNIYACKKGSSWICKICCNYTLKLLLESTMGGGGDA